jgi:nicotinamide-nucleotide amidase
MTRAMSEAMDTNEDIASQVITLCRAQNIRIATAESCTGGLISAALTAIPGSSDVLDCGFVTYSNLAKMAMLGVSETALARHGAVSEEVARAMAEGALARSPASLAVAVTGIAGPNGGSAEKPVGRVHVAVARHGRPTIHERLDLGDLGRSAVRERTVNRALELLRNAVA